jgi:hypothetical protein
MLRFPHQQARSNQDTFPRGGAGGALSLSKQVSTPSWQRFSAAVVVSLAIVLMIRLTASNNAITETKPGRNGNATKKEGEKSTESRSKSVVNKDSPPAIPAAADQLPTREVILLKTLEGNIRIELRPDLSPESVDYVHKMLAVKCSPCNLYRAEDSGILQGILKNEQVPTVQQRGKCPKGSESVSNNCPDWDKQCGCHGPIMTKGMPRPGCDWPRRQIWLMLCSSFNSFFLGLLVDRNGGLGGRRHRTRFLY